jgi:Arc/MetJ-type ribon-helix-helix transcriptional regulator
MKLRRSTISMPADLWDIAERMASDDHYPTVSGFLQELIRSAWKSRNTPGGASSALNDKRREIYPPHSPSPPSLNV